MLRSEQALTEWDRQETTRLLGCCGVVLVDDETTRRYIPEQSRLYSPRTNIKSQPQTGCLFNDAVYSVEIFRAMFGETEWNGKYNSVITIMAPGIRPDLRKPKQNTSHYGLSPSKDSNRPPPEYCLRQPTRQHSLSTANHGSLSIAITHTPLL